MKTISRYLLTLVALFAMTTGAWAEGKVYNSSVDIHDLQVDDILVEGAEITGIESPYGFKVMPYFLRGQYDGNYTLYSSSQAIANSYAQVTIIEGGVLEYIRTDSGSRYTYTPCDADRNPFNAWIVTKIEDLGSGSYRVQITAYQYGSAEVEANINPGEKTNLLDKFTQAKNSGLTVNVGSDDNAYSLNFDKEAIGSILEGNPEEVNLKATYEEAKQQIGTTDVLAKLNVNLTNGSNALNFNAGKVIANLKFLGNIPTGRELQTWYFDNASNLPTELIPTVYDAINKMATITMSHFSTYGLLLYTPAGIADISEDGTSAKFEMPANDLTVNYELVRDMASDMTVEMLTDRIHIKKNEGIYVAEDVFQLVPTVKDVIDSENPVILEPNKDYTIAFQKKDGEDWVDAEAISVGTFRIMITAKDDSNYDGVCYSNEFQMFEGYEVTVPAGEYVTYYRDEPLKLDADETEAKLYTITMVNEAEATVTATQFDLIPQNIPMLIYNGSTETRNILLIPTENPESFMFYAGFKGTTEATTIAASDDTADRYAFNGKQFVWVNNDLAVGANKAWLEIPAAADNARALSIVFGDNTTGIVNTDITNLTNSDWYDLNGRKLNAIPTKKGVYIMNGKKMVIK